MIVFTGVVFRVVLHGAYGIKLFQTLLSAKLEAAVRVRSFELLVVTTADTLCVLHIACFSRCSVCVTYDRCIIPER